MPDDASRAASYAAATENLRSATRWLLTAAAAAGAAVAAGLQLTSIGSLDIDDWPRLAAAAAGLAGALGAVGYMILRTSRLLTNEWITLADLELDQFKTRLRNSGRRRDKQRAAAIDRVYDELQVYRDELYGDVAESISDLYSKFIKANDTARARTGSGKGSRRRGISPYLPGQAEAAAALRSSVDTVVQAANYFYTRSEFAALRRHLARAGAVFAVSIVIFAYAANPPRQAPAGRTVQAHQPGLPAQPAAVRAEGPQLACCFPAAVLTASS